MYRILVTTFVSGLLAITSVIVAHADEADVDFTDLLQESNTDLDAVVRVDSVPTPPSLQFDSPTVVINAPDAQSTTSVQPHAPQPTSMIEVVERSTTRQTYEATPPSTTTSWPGEKEEELPWQQMRTKEISIPVRTPVVELVVLDRTSSLPAVPGQHLSSDTALTPRPRYRRRARNVYSEFVHRAEILKRPKIVKSKPTQRPKPETVPTMAPIDLRKAVAPVADFIAAFQSSRTHAVSTPSTGSKNGTKRSPATDQVAANQKTSQSSTGNAARGGPRTSPPPNDIAASQKTPTSTANNASQSSPHTSPATNDIATSQTTRPSGTSDDSKSSDHQMSTAEAAAKLDQMASLFTSTIKSVLDAQSSNDEPAPETVSAKTDQTSLSRRKQTKVPR